VNRDNGLFIIIGVLVGFIGGYLMQEVMVERQPQRLVHGDDTAGPPAAQPGAVEAQENAEARARAMTEEMRNLNGYLAENPDDAEATLRYSQLALQLDAWPECIRSFEHYIELREETPDLLSDLGLCYWGVDRSDHALELFDRAQELDPQHWQSRFNEAMVLGLDRGDYEAADRVIAELRTLRPNDPRIDRLVAAIEQRRST
jgi:Flp pilus assembly protein TadD